MSLVNIAFSGSSLEESERPQKAIFTKLRSFKLTTFFKNSITLGNLRATFNKEGEDDFQRE